MQETVTANLTLGQLRAKYLPQDPICVISGLPMLGHADDSACSMHVDAAHMSARYGRRRTRLPSERPSQRDARPAERSAL